MSIVSEHRERTHKKRKEGKEEGTEADGEKEKERMGNK